MLFANKPNEVIEETILWFANAANGVLRSCDYGQLTKEQYQEVLNVAHSVIAYDMLHSSEEN